MQKTFFGHPRALSTLFFTEMWERFSYYGMRALLLLYMVSPLSEGGLALDEKNAAAIYGLYTMMVYLMALPGGWLADKLFGLRNAVFYGGCVITMGHFCMAFDYLPLFFIGLLLIVTGTGLLKPNISSLVGQLYPESDSAKRDSGFSIFFLGINIGAFIAPFITGYLGEAINWHLGFGVAGIGMLMGLLQFKHTESHLGNVGRLIDTATTPARAANSACVRLVFFRFSFTNVSSRCIIVDSLGNCYMLLRINDDINYKLYVFTYNKFRRLESCKRFLIRGPYSRDALAEKDILKGCKRLSVGLHQ